jgi:DNA gyrase/topoisomerase IV subunit B
MVLTTLHSGGKYGQGGYIYSGGTHGVGAKCVNAVSEWFTVEVSRDGKVYAMEFERGKTTKKLEVIGKSKSTGTMITFKPDPEIFKETTEFKEPLVTGRLRELAFLNPGLEIVFLDERSEKPETERFFYKDGIEEFVKQDEQEQDGRASEADAHLAGEGERGETSTRSRRRSRSTSFSSTTTRSPTRFFASPTRSPIPTAARTSPASAPR